MALEKRQLGFMRIRLMAHSLTLPGPPAPFFLLRRSEEASRLPVFEARRSGFAKPACDLRRLVVPPMPHWFLSRQPVVDVAFLPAAFGMRCSWRPAPQNRRRPFRNRNESVPELPWAVR